MKSKSIISALTITIIIALSGCSEIRSDYYCGCPEYKFRGVIKDAIVSIHPGIFTTTVDCHISLDNGDNLFIEGGICKNMETNRYLYKSRNRDTFYTVCNPERRYDIKDKCEYEISDISDVQLQALGIKPHRDD
jgi:hypothetical protein